MKHKKSDGFLVADSTGCGKGRTAMGTAANWCLKSGTSRILYLSVASVSPDFRRDFDSLSDVFKLLDMQAFVHEELKSARDLPKHGVLFVPYTSLHTKKLPFQELLKWIGDGGAIVMDESHTVTNTKPQRGNMAMQLVDLVVAQKKNAVEAGVDGAKPKISISFLSGTFASKVTDLPLYSRVLGLVASHKGDKQAPFSSDDSMKAHLGGRGGNFGYFEAVASELTNGGYMLGRQLSLAGVDYETATIPVSAEHEAIHNAVSAVWLGILQTPAAQSRLHFRHVQATGLRLFKALALSGKVDATVRLAKEHLAQGRQVVLSLISTGEAASKRSESEDADDESGCTTECTLDTLVQLLEHLREGSEPGDVESESMLRKLEEEARSIPNLYQMASLDRLKEELGGAAAVAELTGRSRFVERTYVAPRKRAAAPAVAAAKRKRVVSMIMTDSEDSDDEADAASTPIGVDPPAADDAPDAPDDALEVAGKYVWKSRSRLPSEGVKHEIAAFQAGKKKIAILSQACDTGTSLHAVGPNAPRRVQILFELPWSSPRAMQQLGRTHRAGQSSAPLYTLIGANGAEKLFVATISARLASLGALCAGDRSSTTKLDFGSSSTGSTGSGSTDSTGGASSTTGGATADSQADKKADDQTDEAVPADELLGPYSNSARKDLTQRLFAAHRKVNPPPAPADKSRPPPTEPTEEERADAKLYEALQSVKAESYSANEARPFLNRILQLSLGISNTLFDRYVGALQAAIQQAKARGGKLAEPTLSLDLTNSRFREKASVDMTEDVNKVADVEAGTARQLVVRSIAEDVSMTFAEAVVLRRRLIEDGAPESAVYFAGYGQSSVRLLHVRGHTQTFRNYRPHQRKAETDHVRYLMPKIEVSQAKTWWDAAHSKREVLHFVAELPSLWVIGRSFGNARRVARILDADGKQTIGIELDADVIQSVLRARERKKRNAEHAANAANAANAAPPPQPPPQPPQPPPMSGSTSSGLTDARLGMLGLTLHSIAGLSADAQFGRVRQAWRSSALAQHPDKGGNAERFQKIKEAYHGLRDAYKLGMFPLRSSSPAAELAAARVRAAAAAAAAATAAAAAAASDSHAPTDADESGDEGPPRSPKSSPKSVGAKRARDMSTDELVAELKRRGVSV